MTDTPEARAELTRIETEMKALSPTTDAWWTSRGRRNDLRDAIDPAWRVEHGFGTRPDQIALNAWPTKPEARWRILRAYIEDYCGERVGDLGATTKRLTALGRTKLGVSVREWIALVDQLDNDDAWFHVFRDSLSCKPYGAKRFSLMVGGEDDFHWTILTTDMSKVDPPVAGLTLDYETNKWKLVRKAAAPDSVHGSFPHITDFLRSMLRVYQGQWQPHARLRLEAEYKERARIQAALAKPIPHRFLSYRPPSGEPITESAFDEAIKRVRDAGADYWTAPGKLVHMHGWFLELVFEGGGFRVAIERAGMLVAEPRDQPGVRVVSRAQAEQALRYFASLTEHTPELAWRSLRH